MTDCPPSNGTSHRDQNCHVVVARHGERLDYMSRDELGVNWTAQADRPYDPPLTEHGKEQALKLGQHLAGELERLGIPPITAIYTSPFLRCLETSIFASNGLLRVTPNAPMFPCATADLPPICVEYGLSESINEAWYRSWALPNSDGTWAFQRNSILDETTFHPLSRQPVHKLFGDWKKQLAQKNSYSISNLDQTYESRTQIGQSFSFYPCLLESREQQRARMKEALEVLAMRGSTVLLVSHGGPVTHLFEEVAGLPWTDHGESVYCSYSIYRKCVNDLTWAPIAVNKSQFLNESLHGDNYVGDNP